MVRGINNISLDLSRENNPSSVSIHSDLDLVIDAVVQRDFDITYDNGEILTQTPNSFMGLDDQSFRLYMYVDYSYFSTEHDCFNINILKKYGVNDSPACISLGEFFLNDNSDDVEIDVLSQELVSSIPSSGSGSDNVAIKQHIIYTKKNFVFPLDTNAIFLVQNSSVIQICLRNILNFNAINKNFNFGLVGLIYKNIVVSNNSNTINHLFEADLFTIDRFSCEVPFSYTNYDNTNFSVTPPQHFLNAKSNFSIDCEFNMPYYANDSNRSKWYLNVYAVFNKCDFRDEISQSDDIQDIGSVLLKQIDILNNNPTVEILNDQYAKINLTINNLLIPLYFDVIFGVKTLVDNKGGNRWLTDVYYNQGYLRFSKTFPYNIGFYLSLTKKTAKTYTCYYTDYHDGLSGSETRPFESLYFLKESINKNVLYYTNSEMYMSVCPPITAYGGLPAYAITPNGEIVSYIMIYKIPSTSPTKLKLEYYDYINNKRVLRENMELEYDIEVNNSNLISDAHERRLLNTGNLTITNGETDYAFDIRECALEANTTYFIFSTMMDVSQDDFYGYKLSSQATERVLTLYYGSVVLNEIIAGPFEIIPYLKENFGVVNGFLYPYEIIENNEIYSVNGRNYMIDITINNPLGKYQRESKIMVKICDTNMIEAWYNDWQDVEVEGSIKYDSNFIDIATVKSDKTETHILSLYDTSGERYIINGNETTKRIKIYDITPTMYYLPHMYSNLYNLEGYSFVRYQLCDENGDPYEDYYSNLVTGSISIEEGLYNANVYSAYRFETFQDISFAHLLDSKTLFNVETSGVSIGMESTGTLSAPKFEVSKEYTTHFYGKVEIFPVGSIYMSIYNVNPSTYFGGIWEPFAEGKTLIGVVHSLTGDEPDIDILELFDESEKTGGEAKHTLTVNEMPSHKHQLSYRNKVVAAGTSGNWYIDPGTAGTTTDSPSILNTGGGQPHNNLPPYITCYIWLRIG